MTNQDHTFEVAMVLHCLYIGSDVWDAVRWKRAIAANTNVVFTVMPNDEAQVRYTSNSQLLEETQLTMQRSSLGPLSLVIIDLAFEDLTNATFDALYKIIGMLKRQDAYVVVSLATSRKPASDWICLTGADHVTDRTAPVTTLARNIATRASKFPPSVHRFVMGVERYMIGK